MPTASLIDCVAVGSLVRVRMRVAGALARANVAHGQYVEVRVEGARGHFVLANDPGAVVWELVVHPSPGASQALVSLDPGASFDVSAPIGGGFPYADARDRPLFLVTTGSGIAAVLSAIRARIADGCAPRTVLVHGVRARADLAALDEIAALEAAGGEVVFALSRDLPASPREVRGYVQHALAAAGRDLSGAEVFAAGNGPLIEALRTEAPALGLDVASLRLNFG